MALNVKPLCRLWLNGIGPKTLPTHSWQTVPFSSGEHNSCTTVFVSFAKPISFIFYLNVPEFFTELAQNSLTLTVPFLFIHTVPWHLPVIILFSLMELLSHHQPQLADITISDTKKMSTTFFTFLTLAPFDSLYPQSYHCLCVSYPT